MTDVPRIPVLRRAVPLLACVCPIMLFASHAEAQPSVPATFYGSVAVEGEPVPAGTEVRAFIDGLDCTQDGEHFRTTVVVDGISQYSIEVMHESQQPGCGAPGREVTFTVDGRPADQSAEWAPGPHRVDLTVHGGTPLPLPSQSASPGVSETPAEPTPSRPTGTPPTDDVDPDDLLGGGDTQEQQPPAASAEDSGVLPWVLGTAAVTLVAGATTGWYLSRRKMRGSYRS